MNVRVGLIRMMSKVSIVLPVYNVSRYLRQSIESCLSQTYTNIELIIVDDASTDDTSKIIKSFKDKRIICLRHNKNKGLPSALNTGFEKATGEYLTWTSDDNFYASEAIERMLRFLREQNCLFVYADFSKFTENDPSKLTPINLPEIGELVNRNVVGACFLYSRKVRDIIGDFDVETFLAEDYDYWIRVSKKFKMCHLKERLYFFREHSNSLTSKRLREIRIADVLVKVKNNLLDIESATMLFIDVLARDKSLIISSRGKSNWLWHRVNWVFGIIMYRIYYNLMMFKYEVKVWEVLITYCIEDISFSMAKNRLIELVG